MTVSTLIISLQLIKIIQAYIYKTTEVGGEGLMC